MLCPECRKNPLQGARTTCSDRCRQRRSRALRADRLDRARELLAQQTQALASGADPALIAQLAREARRLLGEA
ncbi:hypothetical protein AB4Y72_16380 [Arthrobacter sp. YAF34]|uniref:hypothetical protein n=1 Tax=Arthrobacter sp. YAF34 TaxID=3233083 RepID=UPI003F92A3C8